MNLNDVLQQLKSLGTEQNRRVYKRHGVGDNAYGVSYANLGALKKRIKVDHELALKLWGTGNHDARILATMIADPSQINSALLDAWVKDLSNNVLTDALSGLASRTALARMKMEKWSKSRNEWVGTAGLRLLAYLAMNDKELPDTYFEAFLETIERDIHAQKNFVRNAMNGAVIAIGLRNGPLQKRALQTAGKIGKVDVDHGETNCQTPDAADYIRKAAKRKR